LKEGVFHASLICVGPDGQEEVLDARTSDAVALATRFDCPVFTYEHILEKAGVVLDDTEERTSQKQEEQLEDLMEEVEEVEDLESLHNKLDQAVNNEDYEEAARIRDEISKREKE
jgi:bifunctional DNase/RNase